VDELLEQEKFEKCIFVKAALQLLMEKNTGSSGGGGDGKVMGNEEWGATTAGGGGCIPTACGAPLTPSCNNNIGGIVKSGFLKKANHHSMGTMWKTKLVEIHAGVFIYEDDDNILGRR